MTGNYRCTKCGLYGDLEEGETPDSIRPHGKCDGTRVVEVGSQEELELDLKLNADLYRELGIDPATTKVIASSEGLALSIDDSQQRTHRMLCAVERANRIIAELGFEDAVAIVYNGFERAALLMSARDKIIDREENDDAVVACGVLVLRFERRIRAFFTT